MTALSIAIASTGRLTLTRTLRSLADMRVPAGIAIDVVIADDGSASDVADRAAAAAPLPFAVTILPVRQRNVSAARNACLDGAQGTLLAFVDDDEWVAVDWLERMLAAMADFKADCVFGPVHPVYPAGTAAWIVDANPLHVDWGKRGRRVAVGRSGNTLVRRSLIIEHNVRFDEALGRTGGEDTLFFHTLGRYGAVMVVTDDAHVCEDAPAARVNLTYFRHRALRTGQTYARFATLRLRPTMLGRLGFYAGATVKAGAALAIAPLLFPFNPAAALKLSMRGWMNAGKLRELARLPPAHMS